MFIKQHSLRKLEPDRFRWLSNSIIKFAIHGNTRGGRNPVMSIHTYLSSRKLTWLQPRSSELGLGILRWSRWRAIYSEQAPKQRLWRVRGYLKHIQWLTESDSQMHWLTAASNPRHEWWVVRDEWDKFFLLNLRAGLLLQWGVNVYCVVCSAQCNVWTVVLVRCII